MAIVKDFPKKTTISDNDATVLVDQTTNEGSIMDLDTFATEILGGFKAYTVKGNQYVSINLSGSSESVPSGALFFGYHHVALVSWASAGIGFSRVDTIVTPSGNEVLTLDGNRIYTGTDGNRRLTIIVPKQVALTIEDATASTTATRAELTDVKAETTETKTETETILQESD